MVSFAGSPRGPFVVRLIPNAGDRHDSALPKKIELPLVEWGLVEALATGLVDGRMTYYLEREPPRKVEGPGGGRRCQPRLIARGSDQSL